MGAPDYSAMYAQQQATADKAAERARSQDLEDRNFFKSEADKERIEGDRRTAALTLRTKKEESRRVEDLAEEERRATDTATETANTPDKDISFGNMFASLLQSSSGGNSSGGAGLTSIMNNAGLSANLRSMGKNKA
jgi:hypothetical protein